MALKATIYKAEITISDTVRHYYNTHSLTLARHPSETEERLMIRLLAFCLFAGENLSFTKGLSTTEEPDLWQKSLSGEIEHWIEIGRPTPERIKKAHGQAQQVSIIGYGGHAAEIWWNDFKQNYKGPQTTKVIAINEEEGPTLNELAHRSMTLQCLIDESSVWLSDDQITCQVNPEELYF